ncbi:hypothetical protein BGZ74_008674 [Mortierella antarctica]|nr:hypothetical protein BGZ74_008674 [Mortierella antarctica]
MLIVFSRGMLSSGMYGLALSNMTQITSYAIFSMRQYCDLQRQLVSIECVNEYPHKRTEAPAETGVFLPKQRPQVQR